jgi:hypothetical protein
MAADIVAFALDDIWHAGGAVHDPVAALVFCQPPPVDFAMVDGKLLVQGGVPLHLDVPVMVEHHNRAARGLLMRAGKA